MTTRKVQNPNDKGGAGFLWALLAVIAIAALVIGLIVFNGRAQRGEAIAAEMVQADNLEVSYNEGDPYFTLAAADGGDDAPSVDLFEDFSCSYCADLATQTDEHALERIQAGDLAVNVHPMTILDRQGNQYSPGHSTRALAAELALASHGDAEALWNLRAWLLENQQSVYNKVDNDDLADRAKEFGASDEAVQDIRDGAFAEQATATGQANLDYQNEKTGEAYTPRVMRDGEDLVTGSEITNWVDVAAE
ncbi:Protein-disulfide isomerase [Corynebacterium mycetoides]|uniref:Protein-disulfide isomerase n=1 Tax=Corynebacterium mycetoides TaxID=38302 RepID=A0A1G9NY09_9CORY|nr:thioredoxin domain-containing protein [Corynebacterium mycetoides]SDL90907.1 Protein-disulfide isomerase [Corynebacterium mycetoides]